MAIVSIYKVVIDLDTYESDTGNYVSATTHSRHRDPLYTTSIYQASSLRARYGEDYVDVYYTEIDDEKWEEYSWK